MTSSAKCFGWSVVATLLSASNARAETREVTPALVVQRPLEEATGASQVSWRFDGAAYLYFLPEEPDYLQPTLRVDHHRLHLEARYAYEDRRTGSIWAGLNVAGGDSFWWEITPMAAVVFGRTNGIALGYEGTIGWWKLELYSEGEYLPGFSAATESFFFNWSEFTLAPFDWFRFGLLTQRTRIYSSGRVLERGLLAGFSWGPAFLTLHVLNPDDARPMVIAALGGSLER